MKVYLGVNLSAEEFDTLTDNQREYSELISEYGLHPPLKLRACISAGSFMV